MGSFFALGGQMKIPNHVAYNNSLTAGARLLYGVLLDNIDPDGACRMGSAELSSALGVTDRTVRNWLYELTETRVIFRTVNGPLRVISERPMI